MTNAEILTEAKARLQVAHGSRLRGIVLYGSQARGQAGPDSDVDLLVLLGEPIDYARDLDTNLQALYPLAVVLGRRISAKPVSADEYRTGDCPLYRNARREGVAV